MYVVVCLCSYSGYAADLASHGLPEHWLWPFVRLVPALLVGLLYWVPVYRYARLLWQLRSAVDQRASQFE